MPNEKKKKKTQKKHPVKKEMEQGYKMIKCTSPKEKKYKIKRLLLKVSQRLTKKIKEHVNPD